MFGLAGGAQDTACSLGRSPSPRSAPGPLPQEGWRSAGMRNSSGKEPDTPTPGRPRWGPAHSSAAGGLLGVLWVLGGAEPPPPQPCAYTQAERWGQRHKSSLKSGTEEVLWPCLRADVEPLGQWLHERLGQPVPLSPQNQQLSFKGNIPASNKPPNSTALPGCSSPPHSRPSAPAALGTPANCHLRPVPTTHPPTASGTYPRAQSTGWKGPPSPSLAPALNQAALPCWPAWPPPCHTPWLHFWGLPVPSGR